MADNVLSIAFTANITSLKDAMAEASAIVGRTVGDIKAAAATMPAGVEAAAIQAGAAMASMAPQIQAQAARVLELKAANAQANASIKDMEQTVIEAGGANKVGDSIIQNYSRSTIAAQRTQQALNEEMEKYKILLNEAFVAQVRLANAPKVGPGTVLPGAAGAAGAEEVAGAAAVAGAGAAAAGATEKETTTEAEAAVLGVEATTAAKEAETAALERNAEAQATDNAAEVTGAEAEQQYAASLLAGLTARNAELAATEAGRTALAEHAAATANLRTVRQSMQGVTERTAEQEAQLAAAETRQLAAVQQLNRMDTERTAIKNAETSATLAQSNANVQISATQSAVAEATVKDLIAQRELTTARELAVATGGADVKVMEELAAAQIRAAATSAQLTLAQKAQAEASREAGMGLDFFRARVIAGENGMRAFITTSLTSVPLMIGALVAGFAIHAVDAIKDTELELANLSKEIDVSVANLASLGRAAEAAGAKSDDLTQMFRRLDRTISDAMSGGKQAQMTLKELGIDITSLYTSANPTLTALNQMADYMRANGASAEIMRASMRALGTDSVALAAFLSQGSQGIKKAAEAYADYGIAAQNAVGPAKKLAEEEAHLSAEWDKVKLSLIPVVDWTLRAGEATTKFILDNQPLALALYAVADAWNMVSLATGNAMRADADYMAVAMKEQFAPPKPPPTVTPKPTTPTHEHVPSEMGEFREELSEQEVAFNGSRADMLRMEIMFWDQIIETGRAKGRDLISAKRELAKVEIDLRREINSEVIGEDNSLAALARSGSADRVALEQKTVNDVVAIHGTESKEYERAYEQLMLAKRAQTEEEIRLNLDEVNRSVATFKSGSVQKIQAYDQELAALSIYLEEATIREQSGSESSKIIARGESDYIIQQIHHIAEERAKSVEENKASLKSGDVDEIIKGTNREIEADTRLTKVETDQFATRKSMIDELAAHDIISSETKIRMLDQIAATEFRVTQAELQREKTTLEEAAAAIRGIQGEEDKYDELVNRIDAINAKIVDSTIKRNAQIQLSNQKLMLDSDALFNRGYTTMEQGFQTAITRMVNGSQSFGMGMARMWGQIVQSLREATIQMVLEWVRHEALKLLASQQAFAQETALRTIQTTQATIMESGLTLVHATNTQAQVAATATGQAQEDAIKATGSTTSLATELIQTVKSIGMAAARAGAHAFQWVMEEVPFPANVALAPAAAAAAFTGVMAFTALASAASGAEVPHDMIAQVHKNEMILPANISGGLKSMINERSFGSTSGGSATTHFNYSPSVQALDSRGVKQVLEEHSDLFMQMIRRSMRQGR